MKRKALITILTACALLAGGVVYAANSEMMSVSGGAIVVQGADTLFRLTQTAPLPAIAWLISSGASLVYTSFRRYLVR